MTENQFVLLFNQHAKTPVPEKILKDIYLASCTVSGGNNKEFIAFVQNHLSTGNCRIPTQGLYEIFSKLSGYPSWNVAKAQKVCFKNLFSFTNLLINLPRKEILSPLKEIVLSTQSTTLILSSDTSVVRKEAIKWSKFFLNQNLKVFHFNYHLGDPELLLQNYGLAIHHPHLNCIRPEGVGLINLEKELEEWYKIQPFEVLILDSLEQFISLNRPNSISEPVNRLTNWARLFNVQLLVPCKISLKIGQDLWDSLPLEVKRNFYNIISIPTNGDASLIQIHKK